MNNHFEIIISRQTCSGEASPLFDVFVNLCLLDDG
jgi:hypothetical protein